MRELVFLCLLALVPCWGAKLPSVNSPFGIRRPSLGNSLEPSFNDAPQGRQLQESDLLQGFGGYLPPDPTPQQDCSQPTRFRTVTVTQTSTFIQSRPGIGGQTIFVTSTRVRPQTVTVTGGVGRPQVVTVTRTNVVTSLVTRFVTTTVQGGGATRVVTSTANVFTTILDFVTRTTTATLTRTTGITRTDVQTRTVGQTATATRFVTSTRVVSQNIPGRTVVISRTVTDRDVVTVTAPGRVETRQTTVVSTALDFRTRTVPGPVQTRVSTAFDIRVSTVQRTVGSTQTRVVTNTRFQTELRTTFVTQSRLVTQTVTQSRVVTQTVPTVVFRGTTVTQTRTSTSFVSVPGQTVQRTVTVTRTTTVGGGFRDRTVFVTSSSVGTRFVTRTVGGGGRVVTVTNREFVPCTDAAGYNYENPNSGSAGIDLRGSSGLRSSQGIGSNLIGGSRRSFGTGRQSFGRSG